MVARQYMDERKTLLVDTELPNIDLAAFVDSLIKLNSDVPIVESTCVMSQMHF